jgi:hypothetical protein
LFKAGAFNHPGLFKFTPFRDIFLPDEKRNTEPDQLRASFGLNSKLSHSKVEVNTILIEFNSSLLQRWYKEESKKGN